MTGKKLKDHFNDGLLEYLEKSPTPFHGVGNMEDRLLKSNHEELLENASWSIKPGGKYYIKCNDSSIIAFQISKTSSLTDGFHMVGAHTDSPCLKVKPQPDIFTQNHHQLGVEIYGGVLLNPWFDRDLSLAGRVTYENKKGQVQHLLLDFSRPIAVIPNLAIHLNRNANENRTINKQKEMPPLVQMIEGNKKLTFDSILIKEIKSQKLSSDIIRVLSHEMSFYDTQPPSLIGLENEFISSARLDNLLSCYVGLESYLKSPSSRNTLLVCNDHEEVGSCSHAGAAGPMLKSLLKRLTQTPENYARCVNNSMMISCDNAHALHPNYIEKHDAHHGPIINQGPVIKINSNQRYATNSETAGAYILLCKTENVPYQKFVIRSDMGCGSTIGPITASNIGVKTVDVGVPTFAMHSVRELAGSKDPYYLYKSLVRYFKT